METLFTEIKELVDIYDMLELKSEKIKRYIYDKKFQLHLASEILKGNYQYPNIICKLLNYDDAYDFFNIFCKRMCSVYKDNYHQLSQFLIIFIQILK